MDALVASFEQQTFNDSLKFLEDARAAPNMVFKRWSMLTWSIVSAQVCMETYLNAFISAKLPAGERQAFTRDTSVFRIKVDTYLKNRFCPSLVTNDTGWQNILDSMQLRNRIVHHKSREEVFDELTEQNAERAINSCSDLIKRLHQADNSQYPLWVDKKETQDYDKIRTK